MKFAILIVIFVSVVYAKMSEDEITKEINEVLYGVSDISAKDKIFKFIDHSSRFFVEEEEPQFDYTSDEEEIFENIDDVRERPSDMCHEFWSEKNGKTCLENGIEVESKMTVYKKCKTTREEERIVFTTCHDKTTAQNYYTTYTLKRTKKGRKNVSCKKWRIPEFFAAQNVVDLYYNHRDIIGKFLGTRKWLEERSEGLFLVKGHLAAMADFNDCREKELSSSFLNLAPQFQSFNNGNWKTVELGIRNLVENRSHGLLIYAGTNGIGTLKNVNGVPVAIYLGENSKVPMPKLFYKMVIDETLKKGIVLVGVNNPYLSDKEIQDEYILCKEEDKNGAIADQIKWMNSKDWKENRKNNKEKGYVYACSIEDFNKNVKIFTQNPTPKGLLLELDK